jgi:LacI family transcriptional regulator
MEDLAKFCCQNSQCPDYGKRGLENLTVSFHYGKDHHLRMLYCRSCKARFSERKGTPFFGMKLSQDLAVQALEHIAEGCGVRATSRLVHIHRHSVMRLSRLAGVQAKALHDELVAFSPSDTRGPVR